MEHCRPSPLGVALCSVCAFIHAEPWRFPLYHAALIHARRLAAMVTRAGNPDTLYRDACTRLTLPILRVASLALHDGSAAMFAGQEVRS